MRKYNTEEEKKAAKKAAYKKWRESHLEQERERSRKKNAERKEWMKEYNRQYRKEHKEYYQDYMQKWEEDHKEERMEYRRNRHGWDAANKRRRTSIDRRANALSQDYRYADETRGFCTDNNVDGQWIENHIFTAGCVYCGDTDWTHLGCDRIDNNIPHTQENCVCSCGICNVEREGRRMSMEEFVEYRKSHPRELNEISTKRVIVDEINGVKAIKKR